MLIKSNNSIWVVSRFSVGIDFRRQSLTFKVDPHTEIVKKQDNSVGQPSKLDYQHTELWFATATHDMSDNDSICEMCVYIFIIQCYLSILDTLYFQNPSIDDSALWDKYFNPFSAGTVCRRQNEF